MPPLDAVRLAFKPPRARLNWPFHPIVRDTLCNSEVAGVPPNVMVTFVSFDEVIADGVGNWLVVARVPLTGKVTDVEPVKANIAANNPIVARLPANVRVEDPLLTPVPPYAGCIKLLCQIPVLIVPKVVIEDWPTYVGAIPRVISPVEEDAISSSGVTVIDDTPPPSEENDVFQLDAVVPTVEIHVTNAD